MQFREFIEHCIGKNVVNSKLKTEPPCWHFEYDHVSDSLYLHKAIVCLPVLKTNEFMQRLSQDNYKLIKNDVKKSPNNIVYQRIKTYQILDNPEIEGSIVKDSANEIEVRVYEDLGLEQGQEKIKEVLFKLEDLKNELEEKEQEEIKNFVVKRRY